MSSCEERFIYSQLSQGSRFRDTGYQKFYKIMFFNNF